VRRRPAGSDAERELGARQEEARRVVPRVLLRIRRPDVHAYPVRRWLRSHIRERLFADERREQRVPVL
jgi:hypothetical protein